LQTLVYLGFRLEQCFFLTVQICDAGARGWTG